MNLFCICEDLDVYISVRVCGKYVPRIVMIMALMLIIVIFHTTRFDSGIWSKALGRVKDRCPRLLSCSDPIPRLHK